MEQCNWCERWYDGNLELIWTNADRKVCSTCLKKLPSKAREPHWTKEPPSEPGWYKVIASGGVEFVEFDKFEDMNRVFFAGQTEWIDAKDIDFWWSQPETLPLLPERG